MTYVPLVGTAPETKPPLRLGVDSVSRELTERSPTISCALPPEARWMRRLMMCSHWPLEQSQSNISVAIGCVGIIAAYTTRAVWTTIFLVMFGMDPQFSRLLSSGFYAPLGLMAIFYHVRLFSAPYVMHRLLRELDADGSHLRRIDKEAKSGVINGFLVWGFSWSLSWWLVFMPSAHLLDEHDFDRTLLLAMLPIDFIFGRALEHKAQLFSLYIQEVHELVVESIKAFASGVETILASEAGNEEVTQCYERLHQVECRMRAHVKWVNEVEGSALLAYMAQEACSAVYTAAVALYSTQPWLEFGLIAYSVVQLLMLMRTGLDIARPGDEFRKCVGNLDTPRTMMMLQRRLQIHSGVAPTDYIGHLHRQPVGISVWFTLIRTPLIVRICVTAAVPTIGVAFRTLLQIMNSS